MKCSGLLEGKNTSPRPTDTVLSKNFRYVFPKLEIVSLYASTDQYSAEKSRMTVRRSPGIFPDIVISSPLFCSTNDSCLSLPGLLASFNLRSLLDFSFVLPPYIMA